MDIDTERKVFTIIRRVLEMEEFSSEGIELIDFEIKGTGSKTQVRVFIDKPGGVTIKDCVRVSQVLSVELDVEDPIPHSYTLEVSSPGGRKKRNWEEEWE